MKILAFRLPELQGLIAKFNKKAVKWNLPEVTYQILEEGIEEREMVVRDDDGAGYMKVKVEYLKLEITGSIPRIAGWSIHSKIQPSDVAGQNYVFTTASHEPVESLRTCPLFCEHCQTKRLKKTGYLIQHEDGRQMMVGATCLKDYLPDIGIENLIAYMNKLGELQTGEFDDSEIPRSVWVYSTKWAIRDAYVSIKKYGFVSKSKAEENYEGWWTSMDIDPGLKRRQELYTDVDIDALNAELEGFIPHMLAKSSVGNDFIHNAQLALQSEAIRQKLYGYVAAAVNVWMKDMAEARVKATGGVSEHQGKVGERLDLKGLRITRLSMSEGQFGWTYIYGFLDSKGNQYTWFASKNIGEVDKVVDLRGTVKKHDEFRGVKQTVLTRCTIL
jgi:hypothetical protein